MGIILMMPIGFFLTFRLKSGSLGRQGGNMIAGILLYCLIVGTIFLAAALILLAVKIFSGISNVPSTAAIPIREINSDPSRPLDTPNVWKKPPVSFKITIVNEELCCRFTFIKTFRSYMTHLGHHYWHISEQ